MASALSHGRRFTRKAMSSIQNIKRPDKAELTQSAPTDAFSDMLSSAKTVQDTPSTQRPAQAELPFSVAKSPDINRSTESDKTHADTSQTRPLDPSTQVADTSRTSDTQSAQKTAPPEHSQQADNQRSRLNQNAPVDQSTKAGSAWQMPASRATEQSTQVDQVQRLDNPLQKVVINTTSNDWVQAHPFDGAHVPTQQAQSGNQIFLHSSQASQSIQRAQSPDAMKNTYEAEKNTPQRMPSITPRLVRTKEAPIEGQRVSDSRGEKYLVSGRSQWMIMPMRSFG